MYEVAQAFGVRESAHQPVLEAIQAAVQGQQLLVLLDNFEHLADAASSIATLLACTPHIDLMVTSRARLGLSSEYTSVCPLWLPSNEYGPTAELLIQSPAVALFTIRAQAINAHFALTDANAAAVAQICQWLDGLPLAIELVAARSLFLSPQMLLDQLNQQLALLVSGPADLPQRQQTLEAAINWSYQLLTKAEQKLLQHLAVFAGGSSLSALAVVCGVTDLDDQKGIQLLNTLYELVQNSLVYTTVTTSGEMHYAMLETVRAYAQQKLKTYGDVSQVSHRHADYYYQLFRQANTYLRGPDAKIWVLRLTRAFPDLRCAFQWLVQQDIAGAVRLLIASS